MKTAESNVRHIDSWERDSTLHDGVTCSRELAADSTRCAPLLSTLSAPFAQLQLLLKELRFHPTFKMSNIWPFGGAKPAHPYYPLDAKFAATYVPNETSPTTLVALMSSAFAVVILGSWGALKFYRPQLLASERWIAVWFVLCRHLRRAWPV